MKSTKRKILTTLTALVMTFSANLTVSAQALTNLSESETLPTENSAILSYNIETSGYEFLDEEGNVVLETEEVIAEETAPTEAPSEEITEATTEAPTETSTVKKTTSIILNDGKIVTTTPVTEIVTTTTTTIPPGSYVARYRAEARSEVAAMTTVRTTKKTTTTTTTVTTKTVYKGIDVSKYQGTIDWTKVKKAGIDFVMVRAGYGREYSQVDPKFATNIKGAQAAGIETGVYWYSYATSTSAALQEAKVCYDTIKGYKLSYPVAFDIEDPTQMKLTATQISNIIKVFCDYLESKKYYVCIYSFASMLNTKMNASVLSSYDIWVAHINTTKPAYSGKYGMWQYSHTGKVNGISGNVDLDYSYKNYPSIIKANKLNGYT